jgi:hypothetical protein
MSPLTVTLLIILGAFLILAAYDIYLHTTGGYRATISYRALQAARSEPIIPLVVGLALGILLGHLYWPQNP